MEDRPFSENAHLTSQSGGRRAGRLYGAFAVAGIAGMALAAAVIVRPGEAPPAAGEAAAPVIEAEGAVETAQASLFPDASSPLSMNDGTPEFAAPLMEGRPGEESTVSGEAGKAGRQPVQAADAEPVEASAGEDVTAAAPLEADDPRWGDAAEPAAPAHLQGADPMAAALDAQAENARNALPASGAAYVDGATTSALADTARPSPARVAVAETEAEVAALEAAMMEEAGVSDAAFAAGDTEMVAARIRSYVNLRGAPSNDAEVFTVVASDTRIRSQPLEACGHFCEVEVEGRAGFIGKSFIAFDVEPEPEAAAAPPAP